MSRAGSCTRPRKLGEEASVLTIEPPAHCPWGTAGLPKQPPRRAAAVQRFTRIRMRSDRRFRRVHDRLFPGGFRPAAAEFLAQVVQALLFPGHLQQRVAHRAPELHPRRTTTAHRAPHSPSGTNDGRENGHPMKAGLTSVHAVASTALPRRRNERCKANLGIAAAGSTATKSTRAKSRGWAQAAFPSRRRIPVDLVRPCTW